MDILFEIAVNLYQGFLLIFLISRVLPSEKPSYWYIDFLFELLIGCFFTLYLFFPIPVSDLVVFLIPLLYAWVTKRGTWMQRILWVLIEAGIFTVAALGTSTLFESFYHISFDELLEFGVRRIGFVITANSIMTISFITISHIIKYKENSILPISGFVLFTISLLMEFFIAELLFVYHVQNNVQSMTFLAADLCILVLIILTILLYEMITQSFLRRHQAEMTMQVMEISIRHNEDIRSIYNEMLSTQHEIRHRINAAEQLLKQRDDSSDQKIYDLLQAKESLPDQFITGCVMVDAILTAKKAAMDQVGITFRYRPYPLQKLPIPEAEFCALLSNILDNAIEAISRMTQESRETEPPYVFLSFSRSWDMFYIHCENPMNPNTIRLRDGQFISSKDNASIHGFGTQYIKQVVENAGGRCQFITEGDCFQVKIVLPDQDSNIEKNENQ